jgi:ATP/maltotriose-dependent transcriptional regulator MalT
MVYHREVNKAAQIVTRAEANLASGMRFTTAFVTAVHSTSGHTHGDRELAMRIFANLIAE